MVVATGVGIPNPARDRSQTPPQGLPMKIPRLERPNPALGDTSGPLICPGEDKGRSSDLSADGKEGFVAGCRLFRGN